MSQSVINNNAGPTNGTRVFGVHINDDPYNEITQVDNNTVIIRPRMNTTGLTELKIGLLLPFSQTNDEFTAEIVWGGSSAIRMAMNDINTRGVIPGAYVTLIEKDSFPEASVDQSAVTDAVYASVTLLQQGVIGVIGDVSSSWTSLSALMTSTLEIPQCSFTASAVAFSDKTQYKYFFRTVPTQVIMADVMLAFAAKQGWSKVGVIYTDDPVGQQFCQHTIIQASNSNIQITRYQAFSQENPQQDAASSLYNVTTGGARVILVAATGNALTSIMLQAAEMGYMENEYVWLLIGDPTIDLQNAIDSRNSNLTKTPETTITKTKTSPAYPLAINSSTPIDFNSTYNGLFMFDNWLALYGYPPFDQFMDAWSGLDSKAYPYAGNRTITTNEGLAYSCMMVMAEGFSHTIANTTNHTHGLEQLRAGDLGQYMTPPAFNVGYVGPEGPMMFDSNGDVTTANYEIYNLQYGISNKIGNSMNHDINITGTIMFHDGSSHPPSDAPPSNPLNPNLTSPIGQVILIVSSLGILIALSVLLLVIVYRKNEIFKASSPLFCCLELVGFIMTYSSVMMMIGIPDPASCYVMPVLFNLGFLLILGNLIAKNYRIYRIFNNIFITRTVITDLQLIKTTSMVVAVDMIILIIGLVVSQPLPRRIDVSFSTHYWECHAARNDTEIVFLVLSAIYAAAMLLFATFLAYKTRAAGQRYSHYSETKQMGLSVYNILFSALIGFAILVNPMADFYTKYYIVVIAILWATTFSLLALFLPKVQAFIKQQHKERAGIFAMYHHLIKRIRKHHYNKRDHESSIHHNQHHQQTMSQNSTSYGNHSGSFHTVGGGELISLNQMVHHGPLDSSEAANNNYVEVHEGEMPIRRVFRYFPIFSHWEMQHIMVFPCLGYFSFFSERTKEGAVMSYREATIHSAQLEEYVLKIHGQGMHDMYIQLPDLDALKTWQSAFNDGSQRKKQQEKKNIVSSSFLHLDSDDDEQKGHSHSADESKHIPSYKIPPSPILQQPQQQQTHHSSQRNLLARRESERSSVTSETVAVNDHSI